MFFKRLRRDVEVVFDRDPAAGSWLEVVICYSGLHAIWWHRIAHWWYKRDKRVPARIISTIGRLFTGIEIHPGAQIGEGLFIDHGSGVVIGETAVIGNNVTLYQGVTLGGTGKEKGKRHPTIGDYVVVAAGAKVLGSFTVGEGARIGAGSVVLKEVPPHATVVGIPGRIVAKNGKRIDINKCSDMSGSDISGVDLNHDCLPDPVYDVLMEMQEKINILTEKLEAVEKELQDETNKSIQHYDERKRDIHAS